ncbi:MAG TPA: hypothetical protein VKW78_04785 [Terriglobales bacterium]|nr:hypothetical protein [Terriglobales bacterium]
MGNRKQSSQSNWLLAPEAVAKRSIPDSPERGLYEPHLRELAIDELRSDIPFLCEQSIVDGIRSLFNRYTVAAPYIPRDLL